MSPMQQMFLGAGGGGDDPLYIDDVFSIDLWKGTGGTITHTNGLDLSTEGGMVWVKSRSDSYAHVITDTARGTTKQLQSNTYTGQETNSARVTAFNTNGFTTSYEERVGANTKTYAAWSWRKAKKWFDIQTYAGNSTAGRQISHNLGCVPGFILIKRYDGAAGWVVYHGALGGKRHGRLDTTADCPEDSSYFNNTDPTDSVFTVGNATNVNGSVNDNYIAYIFGGGESTAATARSVDLDGNDYLYSSSSSDFTMGTGDFTVECWARLESLSEQGIFQISSGSEGWSNTIAGSIGVSAAAHGDPPYWEIAYGGGDAFGGTDSGNYPSIQAGNWYHIAYVRASGVTKLYVNGQLRITKTDTHNYSGNRVAIGRYRGNMINGSISNFRVVKGTAVYTADFVPPTEPLTDITNTKLLCCNNSSTTGTTVGTIASGSDTNAGNPTASVNSPFDDPAGFAFGPDGDQGAIKVGRYNGNGSSTNGPEIYLGWEPALIIFKDYHDSGQDWNMFDSMRGIFNDTAVEDQQLKISDVQNEGGGQYIDLSPTGFRITSTHNSINNSARKYIYVAFRMSDGYVGKPASAGTDVFNMDTGNGSSSGPNFDGNFNVDFGMAREYLYNNSWNSSARSIGGTYLTINSNSGRTGSGSFDFDLSKGWGRSTGFNSDYQSWFWKRHAGFDTVCYKGDGVDGRWFRHSLNAVPEMIWIKRRNTTGQWIVGHKGLDGGNAPWTHYLTLETGDAEGDYPLFHDTAPTSTHFKVGGHQEVNGDNDTFIAYLFASVNEISKVGYYSGSNSTQTITTGFQPRYVFIKNITESGSPWAVFDTVRGWGSGADERLRFNEPEGQNDDDDVGAPTSTGFTVNNIGFVNESGANYIYYCHA